MISFLKDQRNIVQLVKYMYICNCYEMKLE